MIPQAQVKPDAPETAGCQAFYSEPLQVWVPDRLRAQSPHGDGDGVAVHDLRAGHGRRGLAPMAAQTAGGSFPQARGFQEPNGSRRAGLYGVSALSHNPISVARRSCLITSIPSRISAPTPRHPAQPQRPVPDGVLVCVEVQRSFE